jgi:hypothetical protein
VSTDAALGIVRERESDYVVHRVVQELRRLAVAPEAAAVQLSCRRRRSTRTC